MINLNGWEFMSTVPKDRPVDILDSNGDRYMDCYSINDVWYNDTEYGTLIIYRPVCWMSVYYPYVS